mmetsp:Transcript_40541/g.102063  ORF Transcript_40541/g.102063 Transcript_40541/m.102063 type:complete len:472 (-) Transcript_40541:54-1469(-)
MRRVGTFVVHHQCIAVLFGLKLTGVQTSLQRTLESLQLRNEKRENVVFGFNAINQRRFRKYLGTSHIAFGERIHDPLQEEQCLRNGSASRFLQIFKTFHSVGDFQILRSKTLLQNIGQELKCSVLYRGWCLFRHNNLPENTETDVLIRTAGTSIGEGGMSKCSQQHQRLTIDLVDGQLIDQRHQLEQISSAQIVHQLGEDTIDAGYDCVTFLAQGAGPQQIQVLGRQCALLCQEREDALSTRDQLVVHASVEQLVDHILAMNPGEQIGRVEPHSDWMIAGHHAAARHATRSIATHRHVDQIIDQLETVHTLLQALRRETLESERQLEQFLSLSCLLRRDELTGEAVNKVRNILHCTDFMTLELSIWQAEQCTISTITDVLETLQKGSDLWIVHTEERANPVDGFQHPGDRVDRKASMGISDSLDHQFETVQLTKVVDVLDQIGRNAWMPSRRSKSTFAGLLFYCTHSAPRR